MADHHYIPIKGSTMTTYIFKVVVEPDEEKWSAYCPALLKQGAATWGDTEDEALKHIQEVVQMIVQELLKDGEPIPKDILVSPEPLVSVTV
jgi:predicted RNase H-like HicB family nuclease